MVWFCGTDLDILYSSVFCGDAIMLVTPSNDQHNTNNRRFGYLLPHQVIRARAGFEFILILFITLVNIDQCVVQPTISIN